MKERSAAENKQRRFFLVLHLGCIFCLCLFASLDRDVLIGGRERVRGEERVESNEK